MPWREAPCVELGSAPDIQSLPASSTPSDISSGSSPERHQLHATPLFRALAMPPPPPQQPQGQEELERRLPGFRRIVIPRELTLIELLKQSSGVQTDDEVLGLRSAKLRVVAERTSLRRLHVLIPRLRALTLDGSALTSLRDLGTGLTHLKELRICRCGLTSLDGILGLSTLRELYAAGNRIHVLEPLASLHKMHTLDLSDNPISASTRIWTLRVCGSLRRLNIRGSPLASTQDYIRRIASTLPALQYLDDFPLHDSALDELDELFGPASSSSDSESEEKQELSMSNPNLLQATSTSQIQKETSPSDTVVCARPRPATTTCAGARPGAPRVPPRPHTARPATSFISSMEHLNSLIDEESRCSGSRLTSGDAVCGNIAQALRSRRPTSASSARTSSARARDLPPELEALARASELLAAEIPITSSAEDWAIFRQTTGIDFQPNSEERPVRESAAADASRVLSRLEQIERETQDRLRRLDAKKNSEDVPDDLLEPDQIDVEDPLLVCESL